MIEIIIDVKDLKKALSIVSLAIGTIPNTIRSHTLFDVTENGLFLYSTDEDKLARSYSPFENIAKTTEKFTIDPKLLLKLLNNSESDKIRIVHNPENNNTNIYASDNQKSFISFPSFHIKDFLSFDFSDLAKHDDINSDVLLKGLRFIQGFLPKDDKNTKYGCLFFDNGAMYGSNGYNQVAALQSSEFDKIPEIALRKQMLPSIISMIDTIKENKIAIKSSNKYITFSSVDDFYCFGFRKSITQKPKYPISLDIPNTDGFNINRLTLVKKLSRLSLSTWDADFIIEAQYGNDQILKMKTETDRPSFEEMDCERISGENSLEFLMECNRFKDILSLFSATNIDFYVFEKKCTLYNKAELIIEVDKKETKIPFIAVADMFLARKI